MLRLEPHPSNPPSGLRLEASLTRNRVRYVLQGDIGRLRVPEPRPPRVADGLWQHTCFELFVCRPDEPAYHELNFSPSGEWAAYAFTRYREGGVAAEPDPAISVRREPGRLQLEAMIRLESTGKLRIGLSAVIEDESGKLSYWALRHPPGKPDFHHREGFALALE